MDVDIKSFQPQRVTVVKLQGDIDHHTSLFFRTETDKAIKENNTLTLILDFAEVSFMDSSGIGFVMGRYKLLESLGGKVIIANPPVYIRKVFNIAGITRLAKIITDYSEYTAEHKNAEEVIEKEGTTSDEKTDSQ